MKYNVGDKVYHKYHKAICKIIDIDFFRKKYRVVVNGKAIWTYEEEDALEPYTETECERDKCVNAESCEKCKEESIPTMHYPQVDGVTPSVIKHDEPLSQEEIDRCLTALSERDSINDYPEKYPKTDAVVAGREMTKYKLSDYDEGHRDGYEVGYEIGCKDTSEKLAKAYASGAGLDIDKIRQEEYQRGYKEGSKVSEEARKAFYQQGYDEGEQAADIKVYQGLMETYQEEAQRLTDEIDSKRAWEHAIGELHAYSQVACDMYVFLQASKEGK